MNITKMNTLHADALKNVFLTQLDIVNCSKQYLIGNIPSLIKLATFKILKAALEEDLEDIKKQQERMTQILNMLGQQIISGNACLAMNKIMEEANSQVLTEGDPYEKDMSIIFYMEVVEHIQTGAYRILNLIASKSGYEDYTQLIKESFDASRDNAKLFHLVAAEYIIE